MDDDALELLPQVAPPRPRGRGFGPPGLVFVGIQITWDRRIADYALLTDLAQHWEGDDVLNHWTKGSESLHVGHTGLGYCVDLRPGEVRLELQVPELGILVVDRHVDSLVGALATSGRTNIVVTATAQFLHRDEREFEELMFAISKRLYNVAFFTSVGATLNDMSYLVDVVVADQWYQIGAGALRAHEVLQRVASDRIPEIPEVALFVYVTSRWELGGSESELRPNLDKVFNLADSVFKELHA